MRSRWLSRFVLFFIFVLFCQHSCYCTLWGQTHTCTESDSLYLPAFSHYSKHLTQVCCFIFSGWKTAFILSLHTCVYVKEVITFHNMSICSIPRADEITSAVAPLVVEEHVLLNCVSIYLTNSSLPIHHPHCHRSLSAVHLTLRTLTIYWLHMDTV